MRIQENTDTQRRCIKCKEIKPLTTDNFYKEKSRPLGFGYTCKPCETIKARTKPSYGRLKFFTREQQDNRNTWQRAYYKTVKGRAVQLLKAYQRIDKKQNRRFNLDQPFLIDLFSKPCIYCGDSDSPIGADRVDNEIGHVKTNIVPACGICNIMRGNTFNHAEMLILGQCVKQIKEDRSGGLAAVWSHFS